MKKAFSLMFILFIGVNAFTQDKNTTVKIGDIEINLPGKWKFLGTNNDTGQSLFQNDSTNTGITLSGRNKTAFEFYKEKFTDSETVEAFYKWDADYWQDSPDFKVSMIKKDEKRNYVVWALKGEKGENIMLYGLKKNHLIGLNISNEKFTAHQKIMLLEGIFNN